MIKVAPPEPTTETMIPLVDEDRAQDDAITVLGKRGVKCSRSSVFRWADTGMAVGRRGGPLVVLPSIFYSNRRHTSIQALTRFLKAVDDANAGR